MKNIFVIAFCFLILSGKAQEYRFKPNWNKGESKKIEFTENLKTYEDNKLISEENSKSIAIINITNETKSDYTFEFLVENKVAAMAKQMDNSLEVDLKDFEKLKLLYSVDKKTAELKALNFNEAQKMMSEGIDKIYNVLKSKYPKRTSELDEYSNSLKDTFSSEKKINDFVQMNYGYLFVPFNKDFVLGKTLSEKTTHSNSLNLTQDVESTTHTTLVSTNENAKTSVINQKIEVDVEEILNSLKKSFSDFVNSLGQENNEIPDISQLLDGFDFGMEHDQNITFNQETSWSDMTSNVAISVKDPIRGIENKKVFAISATIK